LIKIASAILVLFIISGCSSYGSKAQRDNSPIYKVIATAETELDKDGNTCADATGTIRVYKNGVYGSALDSFGRGFKITGKLESGGRITGGFAISVITAVDFTGQLDADKKHANGTWEDVYECSGKWKATIVK